MRSIFRRIGGFWLCSLLWFVIKYSELSIEFSSLVDPPPTENKKTGIEKKILSRTFCGSAAYAAPEILRGQE